MDDSMSHLKEVQEIREINSVSLIKKRLWIDSWSFGVRFAVLGVLFVCLFGTLAVANPFLIDFPEKEELTNDDYLEIQEKLRNLQIEPVLKKYYERSGQGLISYNFFRSRLCLPNRMVLIDPEKGQYPKTELVKINRGGNRCIVVFATYNRNYPQLVDQQIEQLGKVGFDGYYLYFLGALPNPTGKEIKYAGIPYGFKAFAMLEAKKRGFNSVICLDSALFPLKNPSPLFEELEKTGAVFRPEPPGLERERTFPETLDLIYRLTRVDLIQIGHIHGDTFGLDMEHPLAKEFFKTYYEFADIGYPFLAAIPDETVWSAIIGQPQFSSWRVRKPFHSLITYETKSDQENAKKRGKHKGFFFYREAH
jgi:hypothetical protein